MPKLPKQLPYPFCESGDRNNIPYTANIGNVNYNLGYDGTFGTPLDQGGSEINRRSMNAVLYDATENIYAWQTGVPNYWRQFIPGTEQTTQERQVYDKGAVVWYNKILGDDSTATMILSKVNNNTTIPNDDEITAGVSDWAYVYNDFSPIIITKGARIYKGVNDPVMKGFLKLDGREITEAEYDALPADIRDSITTGGGFNPRYLLDTRTFSGSEIESQQIVITKNAQQPEAEFEFQGCLLTIYKDGRMTYEGRTTYFIGNPDQSYRPWVTFPLPFVEPPEVYLTTISFKWGAEFIYNSFDSKILQAEQINTDKMLIVFQGHTIPFAVKFKVSGYLTPNTEFIDTILVEARNVPVIVDIPDPISVVLYSTQALPSSGEVDNKLGVKWYYKFEDPTGQGINFNIMSGGFQIGTYNKSTQEFRIDGEGFVSFPNTYFVLDPLKPFSTAQYDLVQQVLIEDNSTALRFEERVVQNFGYDNVTLKVNQNNDLYMNLDTTQTVYDTQSQVLRILDATNDRKGVASFSDNFTVVEGDVDVVIATDTQKGIASFNPDTLVVTDGEVTVKTASATDKGVASFGDGFTIVDGHIGLVPASANVKGVCSFDNQYLITVDGFVSLNPTFVDSILNQWTVVSPTVRFIKYRDGRQILETQFTIPTGTVNAGPINITFPTGCVFIVDTNIKYTVRPVSLELTAGGTGMYFTDAQYVSNLRLNTTVTTPMQAGSVALVYDKTAPNAVSGVMRLRIEGFWKTLP